MATMLDFAIELAYQAGTLLRVSLDREYQIRFKGDIDLVTDVDQASEALLVQAIRSHYPNHSIVAEEGNTISGTSAYTWLIDPLDGTTSYVHGYPAFCVSLGLWYANEPLLGVVYDPLRNELFSAQRGHGAYCNGRRLRVSSTTTLSAALLSTGFPYDRITRQENNIAEFSRMIMQIQDVRRSGSAALDLCYVAAGRSDGHWETGLQPWDTAAGTLLVTEAGGQVSDWLGQVWTGRETHLVASNRRLHADIVRVLATAPVQE